MFEWLRALSPPSRYLTYLAGVLLVLSMAVGVGVTVAVVVGWQSGRVANGSAETSTLETSMWETTGAAKASEGTVIEPSDDTTDSVSFVHRLADDADGTVEQDHLFDACLFAARRTPTGAATG